MNLHKKYSTLAAALLVLGLYAPVALAEEQNEERERGGRYGGENRGKPVKAAASNSKFQQECSSCHIPFAPELLPAESWRKLMGGLNKHFGSDAALDAQDNKEITAFLVAGASNRCSAASAPLRITETAWFKSKHDAREVNPAVWKKPQVKTPANCSACHPKAAQGNFNERDIRIPK